MWEERKEHERRNPQLRDSPRTWYEGALFPEREQTDFYYQIVLVLQLMVLFRLGSRSTRRWRRTIHHRLLLNLLEPQLFWSAANASVNYPLPEGRKTHQRRARPSQAAPHATRSPQ